MNETLTIEQTRASEFIAKKERAELLLRQETLSASERKELAESVARLSELKELQGLSATLAGMNFGVTRNATAVFEKDGTLQDMIEVGPALETNAKIRATTTNAYKTAFMEMVTKQGFANLSQSSRKTLQEASDQEGGFLVPSDMSDEIIKRDPAPTSLLSKVRILDTSVDSAVLPYLAAPAGNIFSSAVTLPGSGELPPTSASNMSPTPQFGAQLLHVYTFSGWLPVSLNLIEDAAFDIQGIITEQFRDYANLWQEEMIVTGSGVGQPVGLRTLAESAVDGLAQLPNYLINHAGATAVADACMQIPFNVPPQYEDNLVWILNKTNTGAYVSGLKDLNNRYLFGQGLQDGGLASARPTTLCGYPFYWESFMDNVETSGTVNSSGVPFIFGDFQGYKMLRRSVFSIKVLDQPMYTQNQAMIVGKLRFGGAPLEGWKFVAGVLD